MSSRIRFAFFPIALKGDDDGDLVPDELEAFAVIRDDFGEDLTVGDVEDAAGALIGLHPVADFVECELEQPHVDDVARVGADLDAVATLNGRRHTMKASRRD